MAKDDFEISEELFFARFPKKPPDAHKGTFGKILLIGGGFGMAGAVCLNVLGAKTLGASYIHVALPETVYPIAAARFLTPVYHPLGEAGAAKTVASLLPDMRAVGFGSGCVRMPEKEKILELLLGDTVRVPTVLDAEALRMLTLSALDDRASASPLILTPHLGEFSQLDGTDAETAGKDPVSAAKRFSKDHNVILVLKGPKTAVAAPDGRVYENHSGNPALAQAGSGDVLTGMIAAMLTFLPDPFEAACSAVWLHGFLADEGRKTRSCQNFSLESFPEIMDRLFFLHGF